MIDEHPSKESLTEFALGEETSLVLTHVSTCQQCQKHVAEIKKLSSLLSTIPDEKLPANVKNKIIKPIKKKISEWFEFDFAKRVFNPFNISMAILGGILFFYYYFAFIL